MSDGKTLEEKRVDYNAITIQRFSFVSSGKSSARNLNATSHEEAGRKGNETSRRMLRKKGRYAGMSAGWVKVFLRKEGDPCLYTSTMRKANIVPE